jgi:uncharacterized protein YfaS (alpha-2-macroglobulin family)
MPGPVGVKEYDVGDAVKTRVTFKVNGTPTDPDTVTFKFMDPTGKVTTYTLIDPQIVKESTGVYHVDIPIDMSGTYHYRWAGTGAARGALERSLQVRESKFV